MAEFDFGANVFAPAEQSFEDWLKYSLGRDAAAQSSGVAGYGQGAASFASQQSGMATQAANRAREEALRAKTMQAWGDQGENIGPLAEAPPEDVYDPRNVRARANLAASEMSSDRAMMEAQKRAAISTSEALAEQRNAQTSQLKDMADLNERLKTAQVNLAEAEARGDLSAKDKASLEIQRLRARQMQNQVTWQPTVDAEGNPGRIAVPKFSPAGTFIEGAGPAAAQDRELKSHAAIRAGDRIMSQLADPAFMDLVGPALGRANSFLGAVGVAPPEYGRLIGEIRGLSQVLGSGIHGIRAQRAGEHMEELLSTTKDPDLLMATLEGALSIARDFDTARTNRGARSPLSPGGQFAAPGASPVSPGPGGGGAVDHGAVVRRGTKDGQPWVRYADGFEGPG